MSEVKWGKRVVPSFYHGGLRMKKQEHIQSLSREIQSMSPSSAERMEEKLITMLVVLAKGTRYWPDIKEAVSIYVTYQSKKKEIRPRRLPWRV